jgi:hypothetical protein
MQAFMLKLAEAISPKPTSLTNYRRMVEPCAPTQLQVHGDKKLSRVALFKQVQVGVANLGPNQDGFVCGASDREGLCSHTGWCCADCRNRNRCPGAVGLLSEPSPFRNVQPHTSRRRRH